MVAELAILIIHHHTTGRTDMAHTYDLESLDALKTLARELSAAADTVFEDASEVYAFIHKMEPDGSCVSSVQLDNAIDELDRAVIAYMDWRIAALGAATEK
jgi:hypothetical protein